MGVNKVKDNGKLWEKRRRDRIKESFQKLARLLPQHDPAKLPPQNEILDKATEFVKELRLSNSRLLNQQSQPDEKTKLIQELQDEVNKLILRVKQLTVLLQKAKIPIPSGPFIKSLGKRKLKWTGIVSSDDIENSCKSRRLASSDNDKSSSTTAKQSKSTETLGRCTINSSDSSAKPEGTTVPLRETNATGKKKVTGPIAEAEVQILNSGHTSGIQQGPPTPATPNQQPTVSQTTITLTPSNPIAVASSISGAIQGFPATIILSQPCGTTIGHSLQQLQVTSQPILPKPLSNAAWPKIAISRITQPIIKEKKTRRRKKKSDAIVLSANAEVQTVEVQTPVVQTPVVQTVEVEAAVFQTVKTLNKPEDQKQREVETVKAAQLNEITPEQGELLSKERLEPVSPLEHNIDGETCETLGNRDSHANAYAKPIPDGSSKVKAKEPEPNSILPKSQEKENDIVVPQAKVTAVNSVTTTSDNMKISLRDKVCTGIIVAKDVSVLQDRSSFPFQESSNIETGNSDEVAVADASLAHKDDVQDKTKLQTSSSGIAESTTSSILLKESSEGIKKMVNNNTIERSEQPESTITDALFPQHQFDCTSGSLNNITDTFDDIEAIIIPKRNKLTDKSASTSAMKLIPSSEAKDKAGDNVQASARTQEDVQLTSDKISECIARSIDLIEQPGSELMDLSADWGDGSSPKSPMSPTKMFLSMFPLSLRDSSAPSDQNNAKSYNYSGIGKSSFHIDAMLPDDTCANASNCNIPSVAGIVSSQNVCSSLQPLNNPSDDYLSIVSSFVAGSCAKNAIEGFSMNLSTDVDGPESSNPFSFINSSDIGGAEGNFLNIRPVNAKDSVGCIENAVGETEKDGYMGLASWLSKPAEKYTNAASVFTNYPPYSSSNTVTSSSINIPTLLPLVGNSSGSNLLLGDSPVKKKPSNKRDAARWPGVSQNADPPFRIEHVARNSSNFQQPPLQSNTGARTSSAMQFTISDLMGSVNAETVSNSQPCASSSRRSQNSFNADLFSAAAVTNKNTGNENVCQYKPYEDHFTGFNPTTSQVSSSQSQSVATGTSSIAAVPSYIPEFQSGYVQYNSRAEHPVPFNHNYTSGFSNAQSFFPTDIYSSAVIPTNNLSQANQPSSSSKRNNQDEGSHPAKVVAVAPKTQQRASKAKTLREDRSKPAATSKQTVDSIQIRQTSTAVPAVDVTRRNFETWSSSSYIYNDVSSRIPSSVSVQPMPKGGDSQPAPCKTKSSTKGSTNTVTRKYEKRNAATSAETTTGRSLKGSNAGTRGSQKSNTSTLIESQPKSKSCAADDSTHNANSMTVPAYGRNSSFYDQTGNQSHNQLFYLPDVTQVPIPTVPAVGSIEMLPFQPSIPPMRHHVQPTEYQPVGLMTPRNPANDIRSNNYPNYIGHDNPPNPTSVTSVRNQRQRGYEAPAQGHLMQNIFSHSANTENKNVQPHFNPSVNCANEVQRTNTNQEASVNRTAISSTKKSNKPADVSYSSGNVQSTGRSQSQQRQQPRSYTNSDISPPVNSSGPEAVSWPTAASRNNNNDNTSCQQKPDSSTPNAFSVSKLVGSTTSSSNNETNNSNRHCVEGLIRKSCANNWNNFNPITSSNSFNSNLQMNDNTLPNTAPKVQAYQPAGTQDYGNYNFMPTHSHHQVASMAQPSQPSRQPYVTNMQSSSSSNNQNFPSHYNYFDASSSNFMSTPSQVSQLPPGGNSGIHQSNPSPRNSGRGNMQENPACQQQQPNFPRFHHGSNNNNAGVHLQQHQQQATSSVSNFNLSSIFPEMNQEVSRNSGDRASHQTSDGQRDNCSSGYYQNQRTN